MPHWIKISTIARGDVSAQVIQPLHRAKRRQRGDHPIFERQAPVPHRAKRQLGAQIGVIGNEVLARAQAEQAAAERRAVVAQFPPCRHSVASMRDLTTFAA
jgi:hypothetical protein